LWRKYRGVVHQHVDPAEALVDRDEQLSDLLRIRAICAHGQSLASSSFHIIRYREGGRLIGDEADRYIVTLSSSKSSSRGTYATTSTLYQNEWCLRYAIH
jgi:hypothetical protein